MLSGGGEKQAEVITARRRDAEVDLLRRFDKRKLLSDVRCLDTKGAPGTPEDARTRETDRKRLGRATPAAPKRAQEWALVDGAFQSRKNLVRPHRTFRRLLAEKSLDLPVLMTLRCMRFQPLRKHVDRPADLLANILALFGVPIPAGKIRRQVDVEMKPEKEIPVCIVEREEGIRATFAE